MHFLCKPRSTKWVMVGIYGKEIIFKIFRMHAEDESV